MTEHCYEWNIWKETEQAKLFSLRKFVIHFILAIAIIVPIAVYSTQPKFQIIDAVSTPSAVLACIMGSIGYASVMSTEDDDDNDFIPSGGY